VVFNDRLFKLLLAKRSFSRCFRLIDRGYSIFLCRHSRYASLSRRSREDITFAFTIKTSNTGISLTNLDYLPRSLTLPLILAARNNIINRDLLPASDHILTLLISLGSLSRPPGGIFLQGLYQLILLYNISQQSVILQIKFVLDVFTAFLLRFNLCFIMLCVFFQF
jgi:hypothetical protein